MATGAIDNGSVTHRDAVRLITRLDWSSRLIDAIMEEQHAGPRNVDVSFQASDIITEVGEYFLIEQNLLTLFDQWQAVHLISTN
ncbi:hypothetical protein T265_06706 [Opisthorchis viverrini]|uniref:Uncharacterized protein n=1 Tax=Opisthorchis viverrini TaxID=6198 RepID=A0A074ZRH3_OPIVI|nr:hypothetical protein T265_06706 [Opisthorchis viverrini]KER25955.1 hypothetical protein T265_06706 [Opisthorchis viverrini]